jgi:hypothetical protein
MTAGLGGSSADGFTSTGAEVPARRPSGPAAARRATTRPRALAVAS